MLEPFIVKEQYIQIHVEATTKEEAIRQLALLLEEEGAVKETYLHAVLRREQEYPTGLPTNLFGVAIPHTDVEHVSRSAIAIGVLKHSVPFKMMGASDADINVEMIFLLALDEPSKQVELLQSLMDIFQNDELLQRMKSASTKQELVNLLTKRTCNS